MHTTLAVSVGNTRIQLGLIEDDKVIDVEFFEVDALGEAIEKLAQWWTKDGERNDGSVLMGSVQPEVSTKLVSLIRDQLGAEVYELEQDIPIPIGRSLDPETIVGVDRLLNAAAAWDQSKQACVIIDAGTAVTVDFVDGEGVFHGGAIMPGAQMQLDSMAKGANLLESVDFQQPDKEAFGRSTASAMQRGVYHGIRGGVWRVIEVFAEEYGAYPLVLATGGDADVLFKDDELITRIVSDLAICGIAVAARHATAPGDDDES